MYLLNDYYHVGVGTRNYYRKIGYELDGPYMSKLLHVLWCVRCHDSPLSCSYSDTTVQNIHNHPQNFVHNLIIPTHCELHIILYVLGDVNSTYWGLFQVTCWFMAWECVGRGITCLLWASIFSTIKGCNIPQVGENALSLLKIPWNTQEWIWLYNN